MQDKRTLEERFWPKVNKDGPISNHRPDLGPCWLWLGGQMNNGYGQFWNGRNMVLAHRFAYELLVGPIPEGLESDHLCRVRNCVNAGHLEPVSHLINVQRGEAGLESGRQQLAKTHCPAEHPYGVENTYWWRGERHCRACNRAHSRELRARRRRTATV